jgi:pyruvate ferredoxin oxidoreductase beta subunit
MEMQPRSSFYQTGSFAVGNRLLDPSSARAGRRSAHQLAHLRPPRLPGLRRGARRPLRARRRDARHRRAADRRQRDRLPRGVLHALPGDLVADPVDPLAVRQRGAVATGVAAALRVKGRDDVRVVAQGGDGGTTDIGFGCLSGMFERNDDVLYICYDNEAYMNTGVQRSARRRRRRAPRRPPPSAPSRATSSARARTCR